MKELCLNVIYEGRTEIESEFFDIDNIKDIHESTSEIIRKVTEIQFKSGMIYTVVESKIEIEEMIRALKRGNHENKNSN